MALQRRTSLARVSLARTSRLAPSAPPSRVIPLRASSPEFSGGAVRERIRPPRKATGFSPAVKLAVRKRAGNGEAAEALCEACGVWLGAFGGEAQHRLARGMGGIRDEIVNGLASAVLLCGAAALGTGCHGAAERRDPHMGPDAGGFWLRHGTGPESDPRFVPILLASEAGSGIRVWLSDSAPAYLDADPRTGDAA